MPSVVPSVPVASLRPFETTFEVQLGAPATASEASSNRCGDRDDDMLLLAYPRFGEARRTEYSF